MKNLAEILLKYQLDFVKNQKRRKLWISSRQIGKSFAISYILAYKSLIKKNGLSLCVSVNSRSASEIIRKCAQWAEAVKIITKGAITYDQSFDQIKFSNGCRILSLPATSDSLRGFTASCVCLDEAAFIPRLNDIMTGIAPTLTRDPDAELILTTTPAGMNGAFYDLYQKALGDDNWYVQSTSIHDAIENGLKVDLDALHSLCPDPEIFGQEYECRFLSEYGSMIDPELIDWYDDIPSGGFFTNVGLDVGSTSDRTAICTAKTQKNITYIDDIVLLHRTSYQDQLKILADMHSKNKYSSGYIDKTGIGSAFAEFAEKNVSSRIKGLQFTISNKTPMYERLRSGIFDHKVKFNRKLKKLIEDDFRNIQRIVTESGQIRYEAGRDGNGHSDATSAIVLVLQAIHDMPGNASTPVSYMPFSRVI